MVYYNMASNTDDFISIFNQYKLLVYNVALNYVQNSEDAEEVTHYNQSIIGFY